MATTNKSRLPLVLLLGIIFLASVCVTCANYDEGSEPRVPGKRERGRQEGEKEEKRHGEWSPSREKEAQPGRERWERKEDEEQVEEEWRGSQRHEDPDERARERYRAETTRKRVEEEREESDRPYQPEREEEKGSSKSQERRNPFLFKSNKFVTLFENENGHIRLLQRFDKRSDLFENLQNYRLVEYRAKPHTLFLPQHIEADLILTVLSGKAILTVLRPNDRNSYNLERGDTIKIPAGTTSYLVNQDDEQDLRVVDLAISVNRPGKVESFNLYGNKNQYLRGFSKNILEASFNTKYETIEKVLLEEQDKESQQSIGQRRRSQRQETNALVRVSRQQIEELKRLAKSSSKKGVSSELEPFNLRSQNPKYSNKFGKLFEITPEKKYPQLQDLDIFISSVEIKEGALMLPHYNSRAIVVLLVNEGKGNLELVGIQNEQQQQEERDKQVQRYEARLSPGDVVIIPAGHPVAVSASSNLNLLAFGINAENNQRNFLTGSDDNVISQIENPVKELTFPGSAQEVNRLLKNQEHSHFASAGPEQKEEESQRKRSPISLILDTFY
ncbi:unnamed protein product [Vicia faba]|uniref:Cupin type-1 domain-containing protein n=1 Tax=Vicia faba TaxID=3906 RepID=A0AAV1A4U9_VICFA|nr:unnamed protein product [Vicia faba]